MKVIILLAFVAAAHAGVLAPIAAPALLNTGASAQYRSQDNLGNYAFGYNEDHATGGTFRREVGHGDTKVGSYGLRDADGRLRIVNYVADDLGFRANIQTNEPGVEPKDPAATLINKAPIAPVAPIAPLHAAPAYAAPAFAAPLAHAPLAHAPLAHAHGHYAAPIAAPIAHKAFSYSVVNNGHAIGAIAAPAIAAPAWGGHLHF